MWLYILEHVSHKRALHMQIKNEFDDMVYSIRDKYALFSKTAYVRNRKNEVLATIQQVAGITPISKVRCGNGATFRIVQAFSLRPKFVVKDSEYEIEGRIYDADYMITKCGLKVLRCRKENKQGKKVYCIEVLQKQYEIEAIAIVVAIEAAKRNLFSSNL